MIWLVWLRVAPLAGCKVTPKSGDPALECALLEAAALGPHRYRVDEIEACVAFDPLEWDDEADPEGRVRAAAAAAREQGRVKFASFGRASPGGSC